MTSDGKELYHRYLQTSDIGAARSQALKEILAEHYWNILLQYGCRTVLDVGCGLGFFLSKAGKGIDVVGIDANESVVEQVVTGGIKAFVGSAEKLPLESASVDGLMCAHVLEHLQSPEKAFMEFYRVLTDRGLLIVRVPPFDSHFYDDWTHVRPYTKKTLQRLAAACGFQEVAVHSHHYELPFHNWRHPVFRLVNRIRHVPVIRSIIDGLISKVLGLPPMELVLIARKTVDGRER